MPHSMLLQGLRPVHNTTQNNALRCVAFASMLVETQYDARIVSDPILALPCVAFLRLVVKKFSTFLVINLCVSRINATQGLTSLCEPAFSLIPSEARSIPGLDRVLYGFVASF